MLTTERAKNIQTATDNKKHGTSWNLQETILFACCFFYCFNLCFKLERYMSHASKQPTMSH